MKKNILKIALIATIAIFSFENTKAQDNQFTLSSSDSKNENGFDIFGFDNNTFYTYYNTLDGTILFESFSMKDLKSQIKTKIIIPEIDGKKLNFEKIIYINKHIYLFTSLINKKNETYAAYVNEISTDGQLKSESTKIEEIKNSIYGNKGFIDFSLSTDSNSILIIKTHDEDIGGETRGLISYKVLDSNLKSIYNTKIELKEKMTTYYIRDIILDNNQNLYLLEKEREDIKKLKDYRMKYKVFFFNSKDSKLYESEINIEEDHMLEAKLMISSDGQLICTGTFAIDKKFGGNWSNVKCLKGVYYVILDKNNLSIISKNKKNIQETFASDNLYGYNLLNVFTLKNNQLILICEYQNTIVTGGNGNANFTHTFGPLIITSFDLNNKNESWVSYFDKDKDKNTKQCKEGYSRHGVFKSDNSFKLLYNCNRQISFDEKGTITDKFIFEDSQNFNVSLSDSYFQLNNNCLISRTYSSQNGYGYTKIVFK